MYTSNQKLVNNQQGLVSIIIVVILMMIISLITLSYANIARNEQRQALDRTLNSQAFYASESGVNYASRVIKQQVQSGASIASLLKTDCPPNATYPDTLQLEPGVSVSCLFVQTSPKSLAYDLDTTVQSKVFPVRPDGPITRVVVEWTPQAGSVASCPNSTAAAQNLNPAASYACPYSVLRVDLTNTTAGLSRSLLAQNTFSAIFMPVQSSVPGAGTVSFVGKNAFGGNNAMQGARVPASCDATRCTMSITFPTANANQYYMRLMPLYRNTQATVTGRNVNTLVSLRDAQIVVDATGKAQDILRRVQVRIPLVNDGLHADYGLQSRQSICKAFTAFDATYTNATACP